MPVVFREGGLRFHFYSFKGDPREPIHIHVTRPDGTAKLRLFPEVRLAYDRGLKSRELRQAEEIVGRRRKEIKDAWDAFFTGTGSG